MADSGGWKGHATGEGWAGACVTAGWGFLSLAGD